MPLVMVSEELGYHNNVY